MCASGQAGRARRAALQLASPVLRVDLMYRGGVYLSTSQIHFPVRSFRIVFVS